MAKGRLQLRLTPEALAELERRAGGPDKRQAYIEAWLTDSRADAIIGSRPQVQATAQRPASTILFGRSASKPRKNERPCSSETVKVALPKVKIDVHEPAYSGLVDVEPYSSCPHPSNRRTPGGEPKCIDCGKRLKAGVWV